MGKIHGSLTRAGKVRGQTPKVDAKANTQKDLTGRSKKRYLCNTRYANLKEGQDPLRMKLNSIEMQVAVAKEVSSFEFPPTKS